MTNKTIEDLEIELKDLSEKIGLIYNNIESGHYEPRDHIDFRLKGLKKNLDVKKSIHGKNIAYMHFSKKREKILTRKQSIPYMIINSIHFAITNLVIRNKNYRVSDRKTNQLREFFGINNDDFLPQSVRLKMLFMRIDYINHKRYLKGRSPILAGSLMHYSGINFSKEDLIKKWSFEIANYKKRWVDKEMFDRISRHEVIYYDVLSRFPDLEKEYPYWRNINRYKKKEYTLGDYLNDLKNKNRKDFD